MTKFQPKVSEEEIAEANSVLNDAISQVTEARTRLKANPYTGKYAELFADSYGDIYAAVFEIRKIFADGFQISDIDDVFIVGTPAIVKLYKHLDARGIKDEELEPFMTDLVMFIYYEVDDLIKWGWLKWILKLAFKVYVAKRLGKLLADLVRYMDEKLDATEVDDRVRNIYQGIRNWL